MKNRLNIFKISTKNVINLKGIDSKLKIVNRSKIENN